MEAILSLSEATNTLLNAVSQVSGGDTSSSRMFPEVYSHSERWLLLKSIQLTESAAGSSGLAQCSLL